MPTKPDSIQSGRLTGTGFVRVLHSHSSPTTARMTAQERERLLEGGRYVDGVTGDPEKDFYSVGRMWLEGGG